MVDVKKLIQQLSSFYKDYMPDTEFVQYLLNLYNDAIDYIYKYITDVQNNLYNNAVETYRFIPYAYISADDGLYAIEDILSDQNSEQILDLSASTLQDRINAWNHNANIAQKIAILNKYNKYVQLKAALQTNIQDNDSFIEIGGNIVNADIYTISGKKLIYGINYVITDNCFYLFGDYANNTLANKHFVAKNIAIDFNMSEKRLGSFLSILYNEIFSKAEYRAITQALLEAAYHGPIIKNLEEALAKAFKWSNFRVLDMYSANNPKKMYWDNGLLGNFDFIVNIPAIYASDAERLNIISEYLKKIKPTGANFFINWGYSFNDAIILDDYPLNLELTNSGTGDNIIVTKDSPSLIRRKDTIKDILTSNRKITDVAIFWDPDSHITFDMNGVYFDTYSLVDAVATWDLDVESAKFDIGQAFFDVDGMDTEILASRYDDQCELTYITFPEYPLDFEVMRNGAIVTIRFKNNSAGATGYHIYRNNILIKTLTPNIMGDNTMIECIDVLTNPGIYEYKVRAYCDPEITGKEAQYSVFTKTISIAM